jgi:(p)ppGpp synthase/HD superfamily hydrolase
MPIDHAASAEPIPLRPLNIPGWLLPKLSFLSTGTETSESFFARIGQLYPRNDDRYKLIEKAYDVARKEFRDVVRTSGERYFEHLRATALILILYLRVWDANVIAAMLLHDIIEDIEGWTYERVALDFNNEVADLVYWVSKPIPDGEIVTKENQDRIYFQRLWHAPRMSVVKKAVDRLHNLITLWDDAKAPEKIRETRDFLIPIFGHHQILVHEIEGVIDVIESRMAS